MADNYVTDQNILKTTDVNGDSIKLIVIYLYMYEEHGNNFSWSFGIVDKKLF